MKTYKIHLIRHGITEGNMQGLYIGNRTDLPLSAEGAQELELLRNSVEYPDIERLYSSPMKRAVESGAILYPDLSPIVIDELAEYDFGEFEGKSAVELEGNPDYIAWTSGKLSETPGGESSANFVKRLALGLNMIVRDMMEKGVYSAGVMMHGGAIMMLLSSCAVPRRQSVLWTSEAGRGYSVMVTPSLYHSSGIIEVYDII